MSLTVQAKTLAEQARQVARDRAAAEQARRDEAARQQLQEQDQIVSNAKVAFSVMVGGGGTYELKEAHLLSAGGHDGVGVNEWPAIVRLKVDDLDVVAKCSWFAAKIPATTVGTAWNQWYFELFENDYHSQGKRPQRFVTLAQLGEILLAKDHDATA